MTLKKNLDTCKDQACYFLFGGKPWWMIPRSNFCEVVVSMVSATGIISFYPFLVHLYVMQFQHILDMDLLIKLIFMKLWFSNKTRGSNTSIATMFSTFKIFATSIMQMSLHHVCAHEFPETQIAESSACRHI